MICDYIKITEKTDVAKLFPFSFRNDFIITEFLEQDKELQNKLKPGVLVGVIGYSDYGGSLVERALIEYCEQFAPQNIVSKTTYYNGKTAIIFGTVDELEEIEENATDEFYYDLESRLISDEIENVCKWYNLEKTDALCNFLEDYFNLHAAVLPTYVDYNSDNMVQFLKAAGLWEPLQLAAV